MTYILPLIRKEESMAGKSKDVGKSSARRTASSTAADVAVSEVPLSSTDAPIFAATAPQTDVRSAAEPLTDARPATAPMISSA